jgi:hypothetical protein
MQTLIDEAFPLEDLRPIVEKGCYDLWSHSGKIIMPEFWQDLVQPDWTITMRMWPVPDLQQSATTKQYSPPPLPLPSDVHESHPRRVLTPPPWPASSPRSVSAGRDVGSTPLESKRGPEPVRKSTASFGIFGATPPKLKRGPEPVRKSTSSFGLFGASLPELKRGSKKG